MANLGQNLVEQQYELENVPMQRLVQMAQQPDGLFPQYLVLTELERRNRYKQAYDAEKASMVGDTTVAQDLVNESASEPPAGINTLGPSSSLSNQVNPAGGIAQAGPQMMADGGAVRYNEGRNVRMDTEEVKVQPSQYYNPDQVNTRLTYDEWIDVTEKKLADAKARWNPFDSYDPTDEEKAFFADLTDEEYKALKEQYYSPISEGGLENLEGLLENRKRWGAFGKKGFDTGGFFSGMAKYFSPIRRDSENMLGIGYNPNFIPTLIRGFGDANTRSDYYGTEGFYTSEGKSPVEFTNKGWPQEIVSYEPIANLPSDFEYAPTENIKELGFGVEGGTVKDGVKSKLYKEGGLTSLDTSIPKPTREEIAKAREMYPDADYETILDIAAGIDTMDITTNENRYKTGGIARYFYGGVATPYGSIPYYAGDGQSSSQVDKIMLDAGDAEAGRRLVETTNQNYKNAVARLAKKYGGEQFIPPEELAKIEDLFLEPKMFQGQVDVLEKEEYSENLKSIENILADDSLDANTIALLEKKKEELISNAPRIVQEETSQAEIDKQNKEKEIQTKIDELENAPDMLASEVERYAGILGLPSAEERQRNKTTSLLLGLGSAISQATQPGDIAKGFPGIQKMLVAEDRQASKDKMGILNLMANQQKLGTLSKKDRLTLLQGQVETLQKQLEQPISEEQRQDILDKIADLNLLIDASLGTSNIGVQTYQEYKENRKGN